VKSSKAESHAKYHKIPVIQFEDQKFTSFSGLIIFQRLLERNGLILSSFDIFIPFKACNHKSSDYDPITAIHCPMSLRKYKEWHGAKSPRFFYFHPILYIGCFIY
jgi:hypothetical protein